MKIQKVLSKAKRPQKNNNKKNNIPTHPMTMPLKRLVKKTYDDGVLKGLLSTRSTETGYYTKSVRKRGLAYPVLR